MMARIPASLLRVDVPGETLAEALPALRATYCGTIAYEVEHLASHEERVWLRRVIESGEHRQPLDAEAQRNAARPADPRSRGSSASCIGPTWARSASASKGWTSWSRRSTRCWPTRPRPARTRP